MGDLDRVWRWRRGGMAGTVGLVILVLVAGCDAGTTRTAAVATATAAPTATPTATPSQTTTTIYYESNLTTPASGWSTDQNCFFASDGYHIKPNLACQTPLPVLGDVDVTVQLSQVNGAATDENGIEIRRGGNPASLYEFDIASNGSWLFKVCVSGFGNCRNLTSGSSPAIHELFRAINTVEVRAVGSYFALLVNGTQVGQAVDSTLAFGSVWLDTDGTSECVFTYFVAKRP